MIGKRCLVSGLVQGVWFRDTTRNMALKLGLQGSAVNLPDGRVEVIAYGEPSAVQALCEWLWEGSRMSRVESVDCRSIDPTDVTGFRIG